MLLDAPATGLEPLQGPLAPFLVERDLVGETDFILEAAFVVAFLGAFEAGTAFFGGISTFTYQILARKFEYIVLVYCAFHIVSAWGPYPVFLAQQAFCAFQAKFL